MLIARGVDLGVQRVQRDGGAVGGLPLQRPGHAQALLVVFHLHITREARVVHVGRACGRKGRCRTEVAVARPVGPAAGVGAFFQHLPLGVGHRQQGAEGVVGPGIGDQRSHTRVGLLGHGVVGRLATGGKRKAAVVERARGAQVDGGPQRALFHIGRGRLACDQLREQVRGEDVEVEATAAVGAAALVAGAHGGERFHAVDADAGEFRAQATHRDGAAFTGVTGDHHAGNALQRLGQVEVGELADVLGNDGIDHAGFAALDVQRLLDAGAVTGHRDSVQVDGGLGGRWGGVLCGSLAAQRQPDRQRKQGNRCLPAGGPKLHVFPSQGSMNNVK